MPDLTLEERRALRALYEYVVMGGGSCELDEDTDQLLIEVEYELGNLQFVVVLSALESAMEKLGIEPAEVFGMKENA